MWQLTHGGASRAELFATDIAQLDRLQILHVVNLDAWSVLPVILINQEPQGVCEVSNFPLLQSFLVLSLGRERPPRISSIALRNARSVVGISKRGERTFRVAIVVFGPDVKGTLSLARLPISALWHH
jgi:hypothetical protein